MMADRQMTMVIVTRICQTTTIWTYGGVDPVDLSHAEFSHVVGREFPRVLSLLFCSIMLCGWSCRCIRVSTTQHLNDVTSQQTSQRCNVSSQRTSQRLNDATCQRVNASTCLNERLNVSTTQRVNVSTCQRVSTNVSTTQRVNVSMSQRMCQRLNDATCKRVNVSTSQRMSQRLNNVRVVCRVVSSRRLSLVDLVLKCSSLIQLTTQSVSTQPWVVTLLWPYRGELFHTLGLCVSHTGIVWGWLVNHGGLSFRQLR